MIHPGTIDALGQGVIVLGEPDKLRVLGRTAAGEWVAEAIDLPGRPRRVLPAGHPGMARWLRILEAGRKL